MMREELGLEEPDPKTIVITELPYNITTQSLIESIEKAAKAGAAFEQNFEIGEKAGIRRIERDSRYQPGVRVIDVAQTHGDRGIVKF